MEVSMFALKVGCVWGNRVEISRLNAACKEGRGSFVDNVCIYEYVKLNSKQISSHKFSVAKFLKLYHVCGNLKAVLTHCHVVGLSHKNRKVQ
jgi:hypothetical protein